MSSVIPRPPQAAVAADAVEATARSGPSPPMVKPNSENSAHRGVRFAESPTPSHIATPTTAAPVASAVAPSTLASAAVDAARAQYLDKHHVYAMIDAALQSLLATRPEDPYAALAACFAKQSESNALTSTGAAATS